MTINTVTTAVTRAYKFVQFKTSRPAVAEIADRTSLSNSGRGNFGCEQSEGIIYGGCMGRRLYTSVYDQLWTSYSLVQTSLLYDERLAVVTEIWKFWGWGAGGLEIGVGVKSCTIMFLGEHFLFTCSETSLPYDVGFNFSHSASQTDRQPDDVNSRRLRANTIA